VETFNKLKSLIEEKGFYIPITGIYNYIKKYNKKKKKKVKINIGDTLDVSAFLKMITDQNLTVNCIITR